MILITLATLGVMLGTAWTGWAAVPLIGLVSGIALPHDRPVLSMAVAGPMGWGILLLAGAFRGPVLELAETTGAVLLGMPGMALILTTLVFPALLGAAAAGVGSALREFAAGREAD